MARNKTDKNHQNKPMAGRGRQARLEDSRGRTWWDRLLDFSVRFKRFGSDILGLGLIILALLTLLALFGWTSSAWMSPWASFLLRWLGWGSLFFVLACGTGGLLLMNKQRERFTLKDWRRVIWLEVFAFAMMALFSIIGGSSLERAEAGKDGGLVGWGLAELAGLLFGFIPEGLANSLRVILLALLAVLGFLLGFGLFGKVLPRIEAFLEGSERMDIEDLDSAPAVVVGGGTDPEYLFSQASNSSGPGPW